MASTRGSPDHRMQIEGVWTQRKKVWNAIERMEGVPVTPGCAVIGKLALVDDVKLRKTELHYQKLCALLRANGRAGLRSTETGVSYLLVECEPNSPRGRDLDRNGEPQPCPIGNPDVEEPEKQEQKPEENPACT